MRALLQRVTNASVVVEGTTVGAIGPGLLVLLGVGRSDTAEDVAWLVNKVLGLRLWPTTDGKPWSASVKSAGYSVLCVSQFTLHGSCAKTKPSFHRSAGGDEARALFDAAVAAFRDALPGEGRVATGQFGAMMQVGLTNDGPVTLWLDSKNRADVPWEDVPPAATAGASTPGGAGASGEATPAGSEA